MPQTWGQREMPACPGKENRVTSCSPENLQRLPEPTPQAVAPRAAERHDWPRRAALRDEPSRPGGKEVAAAALHQPRSSRGRVPRGARSGVGGRGAGSHVPNPPQLQVPLETRAPNRASRAPFGPRRLPAPTSPAP